MFILTGIKIKWIMSACHSVSRHFVECQKSKTYKVASTKRMVRLTWMTMSMYSSAKTLAVKLMMTRSKVGTNTVSKLLIIGLPRVTSTTMASVSWPKALHIRILLKVYWLREMLWLYFRPVGTR